ncbi:hypothetical protein FIM02_02210, partial [SAR202 cluster bacterium AD-802-E10_MRT_200m]|nr:hypothetical protein [SAR202 cluster bacterium AD-802-E10_MRT_200m]
MIGASRTWPPFPGCLWARAGPDPKLGLKRKGLDLTKEVLYTSIDVGTSKICTLVSKLNSEGSVELLGVGMSSSLGLKKGIVVNIEEARESIRASMDEAARASLTNNHQAVIGVTGTHLEMSTRWGMTKSPFYNVPLTSEAIRQSIESARPQDLPPERQVLHLIPQAYSVDGLKGVRNPIGMHALRLDVETLCIVGATTPMQSLIHAVESSRIEAKSLVMSGIAAGEACLNRDEKEMGVVLIDI